MSEALVEARGLSFCYGKREIFHDVDLRLQTGEFYCLMGHNGCGKTTLLDCILGLHQPQSGRVLIAGKDISSYQPHELAQQIAYVPQIHDRSFPYLVREIVLMGRTAYLSGAGTPNAEDKQRTEEMMELVGVAALADKPYTQLSGGEMQMTIMARALVQDTRLIVLDEPAAHLDFYNELLFLETAVRLVRETGKTLIMATHSPNQAFYLENQQIPVRVGVMKDGVIAVEGRPSQILTEENLRRLYRIRTRILTEDGLRQVAPLATLNTEGETSK